ncbi:MAG: DNA-3-methyladenine glycosylase 2 family protein [Candidatus Eremiobacteraeota bacterium]|nr:DNA-3-methyladenine glycosylase 2 family protein [Candidatus Eremiobacteraeota bacterium]
MKRFGAAMTLPVQAPYRLDLTADALRRLASNVVDVIGADGTLYRALQDERGAELVAVRSAGGAIEVRATGRNPERWLPAIARMLGTQVDLKNWYARARTIPWLARLASSLRGLKPPRYPTLWEALAHSILFQQISIHAAAAIMRRVVERLGTTVGLEEVRCVAFPPPQRWLDVSDAVLREAGTSANKIAHLRSAAAAVVEGDISERELEQLPTPEAALRLCAIRGIGPWSASVVLLRGMGRLDTFPLRDSGVARSLALISGEAQVDQNVLLERLGDVRGMLYYHLLLGRMRNL